MSVSLAQIPAASESLSSATGAIALSNLDGLALGAAPPVLTGERLLVVQAMRLLMRVTKIYWRLALTSISIGSGG